MPEGHTIHRIARDHGKWFVGQRLAVSSPQGRFADEAAMLSGRELETVEAHGKHLFYGFTGAPPVHVHLGLFGRFRRHRSPPPEPRGAVRMRVVGDERSFDLSGPTACELLTEDAMARLKGRLGEDPLRADADPERVRARIRKSRAAIGSLLLDQSVVAGIGNVYRAELLHLLGIHPLRPGREIEDAEFEALWDLAVKLLAIGVKYDRIISVDREAAGKALGRLRRAERLLIYKKERCPRCRKPTTRFELANRTIYACDHCQS